MVRLRKSSALTALTLEPFGACRGCRRDVRGCDRTTSCGMGLDRAPRRRPNAQNAPRARNETLRSRREVPLTRTALDALDLVPPRLDSRYVFSTSRRCRNTGEPGPFDAHNFRKRHWGPAIEASGVAKPARLYDLRSTFASNALAAGITVCELARIMGTPVSMIESYYGTLIDTAHDAILTRLEGFGG
jgi:integrase